MSSYDKVVKLACKPKAAPPKAKVCSSLHAFYGGLTDCLCTQYIDPIIAATWTDEGSIHDVCRALSPRIREPNAIVCRPSA